MNLKKFTHTIAGLSLFIFFIGLTLGSIFGQPSTDISSIIHGMAIIFTVGFLFVGTNDVEK